MSFEHCHFCKPPVRYPGCQDHCPYYAEDIAKVRAAKAEEKRQTQAKIATTACGFSVTCGTA